MKSFERDLRARAEQQLKSSDDGHFPYPLFINAFRGFIDEFIKKKHNRKLPDIKPKKEQQKTNKTKRNSINVQLPQLLTFLVIYFHACISTYLVTYSH